MTRILRSNVAGNRISAAETKFWVSSFGLGAHYNFHVFIYVPATMHVQVSNARAAPGFLQPATALVYAYSIIAATQTLLNRAILQLLNIFHYAGYIFIFTVLIEFSLELSPCMWCEASQSRCSRSFVSTARAPRWRSALHLKIEYANVRSILTQRLPSFVAHILLPCAWSETAWHAFCRVHIQWPSSYFYFVDEDCQAGRKTT